MIESKLLMKHLLTSQEIFYLTQVTGKNFGDLPISMTNCSPDKPRKGSVVMLFISSVMEQDLHINISKYEV